jgi:hypothetical protein
MRAVTVAMANDARVAIPSGLNNSISPSAEDIWKLNSLLASVHPQVSIVGKECWGDKAQDHKEMATIVAPKDRVAKAASSNDVSEFGRFRNWEGFKVIWLHASDGGVHRSSPMV